MLNIEFWEWDRGKGFSILKGWRSLRGFPVMCATYLQNIVQVQYVTQISLP